MSISLDQTQGSPGNSRIPTRQAQGSAARRWLVLLFWFAVVLVLVAAVLMRLYRLDAPFDRDSYDEGVYWQSLRAMLAGGSLYQTIFYSQPPLFLLSTFPGFALFGSSLWSARFSIALISLLGFLGAYLLGKTLAGRPGALVALLLLLVNPFYLTESQTIQAEASSVAFTLLAIAFAYLWWKQPDGWRGVCWAALCGMTFALSVLCKLLCISTLVPIVLLLLARIWQILRRQAGTSSRSWLPILAGIGAVLLPVLIVLLPFLGSFQNLWSGMVTFHEVAATVLKVPLIQNYKMLRPAFLTPLALAAAYGSLVALLRGDWRVLPLLAWLVVTFVALLRQYPLFFHHLIALEPPLIALAVMGVAEPAAYKTVFSKFILFGKVSAEKLAPFLTALALLLVVGTLVANFQQDLFNYQTVNANSASTVVQRDLRVAGDLRQAITADEWVVTDSQFVAGLANRNTPPSLVDTSGVRIQTGYLTLAELERMTLNPRVHAVLFYTDRFYYMPRLAGFHGWVALHFRLLHKYGRSLELWVR